MANVTIYSTPTCGYCKMAKAYFQENNVEYTEKDVSVDAAARDEMVQKSGQLGVPVIDIDGNLVVGFDKSKLAELLALSA
ncbi:glutaredoxin family protein [Candidatus Uhrbacteria bacterium]|nr:glutaredoxin family protein [Candidatus Uhrbacteria bacterium]